LNRAIILVSGGLDSLVTASIAHDENDEVYFLHLNYGQKTEARELKSFQAICDYYHPTDQRVIHLSYIKEFGGSSLVDENLLIPEERVTNELPSTYVPFRNGNFICVAVHYAETIKANRIYIGAVEVDGTAYPDCRQNFFLYLQTAINAGLKNYSLEICTPLIKLSKSEIVRLGVERQVPFHLSWSCYSNNELACGKCESCYYRLKSFAACGCKDPIPYAEN